MGESTSERRGVVECVHLAECGACPLMHLDYGAQRVAKEARVRRSVASYGIEPARGVEPLVEPTSLTRYRRRAKLVVATAPSGRVSIGLHRRNDHQVVVDVPGCEVLSPSILALVAALRGIVAAPPSELEPLLTARGEDGRGVLVGLDVRELEGGEVAGAQGASSLLVILTLDAASAKPVETLREAARALRQAHPEIRGIAVQLRFAGRPSPSASELVVLSGASELSDSLAVSDQAPTYQLVSHTSFLHVHREQAGALRSLLTRLVAEFMGGARARVLDLYGGTGAIALALAREGHDVTLVESYAAAVALASRAAQAQRLAVEAVSGEASSVVRALASARASFDVVVANPPRRGLSPAAREAIAALGTRRLLYVACELDNLGRDLDHLARLGYALRSLHPMDMLPLTEEVEVVAVLERGAPPLPQVLFDDGQVFALAKSPHESAIAQPEYPASLVERARDVIDGGAFAPVVVVDPGESGVCLFARDIATAERLRASVEKTGRLVHLAAVRGVAPVKGAISRELHDDAGSVAARTRYRRLALGGGHSILRVLPERLAPHQVRRHLAAIGHPVLGDMRYGHAPTNRYFEEKHGLDRSFLHLVRVEFDHPDTGERHLIEAPLAPDLRVCLLRAADESVLRFLEQKQALGVAGARVVGRDEEPPSEAAPESHRELDADRRRPGMPTAPPSLRGRNPLNFDDAPRTIRGELVSGDEQED